MLKEYAESQQKSDCIFCTSREVKSSSQEFDEVSFLWCKSAEEFGSFRCDSTCCIPVCPAF